ncbi:Fork head domain-containing protein FD4 [Stylophora pistillata]|uniref:Fork head domain-containing protein FD4 n=1 Tax=Stylophora pistillata TaxID=50429 RepID=A0A2B4SIV1_STYPI|nr:Fork head domain-containing protein FD4 [Stylophora pistillata]
MSAFSPVSSYEKAPDYFPTVPSVSTVTWPSAVPTAFELGPWYSWGLPHSKLNCHGPPAPAAVAPLDYTSFWPTVPSLGSCGFFLPSGSSLARSYEKPSQSYIGLIAEAILGSPEKKLVLSDIYSYILTRYPYFRTKGSGWRNSIRHNLSLNDCFIKAGRSPNAKNQSRVYSLKGKHRHLDMISTTETYTEKERLTVKQSNNPLLNTKENEEEAALTYRAYFLLKFKIEQRDELGART